MSKPTLHYFPARGRGEQIRVFLHELGVDFEDHRVAGKDFAAFKQSGKAEFGFMPVYEEEGPDGVCLSQGPVIMSYLARKHGRYEGTVQQQTRWDMICASAEDLRSEYFKVFAGSDKEKKKAQEKFLDTTWKERWGPNLERLIQKEVGPEGGFIYRSNLPNHADVALFDVIDACMWEIPGFDTSLGAFPHLNDWFLRVKRHGALSSYLNDR